MPFLGEQPPGHVPAALGRAGWGSAQLCADMAACVPLTSEAMEVGPQASRAWPLTVANLVAVLALPACLPHGPGMVEEGRPLPLPQLVPHAVGQPCCPPWLLLRGRWAAGEGLHQGEVTREGKTCNSRNIPTLAT